MKRWRYGRGKSVFPQMSDPITSFKLGYTPGHEKEFWKCGTSQESPNFVENPKDDHYDNLYVHAHQGLVKRDHLLVGME